MICYKIDYYEIDKAKKRRLARKIRSRRICEKLMRAVEMAATVAILVAALTPLFALAFGILNDAACKMAEVLR